jgi:hypothetical protein
VTLLLSDSLDSRLGGNDGGPKARLNLSCLQDWTSHTSAAIVWIRSLPQVLPQTSSVLSGLAACASLLGLAGFSLDHATETD